jgi:hypothetical protein
MKSRQFCSVCKQWLDMEVVPTGDGDDDGVVWFRCPQCQGFLPKLGVPTAVETGGDVEASAAPAGRDGGHGEPDDLDDIPGLDLDELALDDGGVVVLADGDDDESADDEPVVVAPGGDDDDENIGRPPLPPGPAPEPVHEYAAMLAEVDPEQSVPYRPWESYEVGQCILHLAWNDCGVVVAKEQLPGGRRVVKCWFQGAGVVRLIENAPR